MESTLNSDYTSACRMIWDLAGHPAPTDPASGEGVCAMCSEHDQLHMQIGPNFTDYRKLAHVNGTRLCAACSWAFGGKPPNTLRMWTIVARLDQPSPLANLGTVAEEGWSLVADEYGLASTTQNPFDDLVADEHGQLQPLTDEEIDLFTRAMNFTLEQRESQWVKTADLAQLEEELGRQADPIDLVGKVESHRASVWSPPQVPRTPYVYGDYLHLTNRKDMRWVAATLADPPDDGSPWLVSVAESGQKHSAPFTPINRGAKRWTVAWDGIDISSTPAEWRHVLSHSAALRGYHRPDGKWAGFSAAAVESGQPPVVALTGEALNVWRTHAPHLAPYHGTPLLHLANLMITKETMDDYIRDYPTN